MKQDPHLPSPLAVTEVDLLAQYELYFPDALAAKTVVIVPSLTLDTEILAKITGAIHYEERLLCLLMLLRMPRTHLIYLSSMPIDRVIIDYYLHLLPGITGLHARQRLTLLACYDASSISLTEKVLSRPRLMERIRRHIPPGHVAHLSVFNSTPFEEQLAAHLGIPLYACPSALNFWGTKSGSREIFRRAEIPMPPGFENLGSMQQVAAALSSLKADFPWLRKAMVKLNDGFSGDGNAIFTFTPDLAMPLTEEALRSGLHIVAKDLSYDTFAQKLAQMQGIVEGFVDGDVTASPSVQCRITPAGDIDIISTHDQVLDQETGQVYLGATFPAQPDYCRELGQLGYLVAKQLRELGVLGRFGVDFMSVKQADNTWVHYALEINLRKGGTTHPYLMLQYLTNGRYNYQTGLYEMPNGQTRYYFTTDGLQSPNYCTLTPEDLLDLAICNQLHYDGATQTGVMFHLIGALSQYGKLGVLCVGTTPQHARQLYDKTVQVLDDETQ